jgi:hypothetical protein
MTLSIIRGPVRSKVFGAALCLLLPTTIGGAAQERASLFVDATEGSGLDFTHINGATGALLLPEVIGAGGAIFDYDHDGDLDIFAVQGGTLGTRDSGPAASKRPALSQ